MVEKAQVTLPHAVSEVRNGVVCLPVDAGAPVGRGGGADTMWRCHLGARKPG